MAYQPAVRDLDMEQKQAVFDDRVVVRTNADAESV
jgi:hypothetical protein